MADMELLQKMGSLKVERNGSTQAQSDASHHVLRFNFPDFSLPIKPEEVIDLQPPAMMAHRSKPPRDSRDLAIYDTDFAMALSLQRYPKNTGQPETEYIRLMVAIEALREDVGTTAIGILCVYEDIWSEAAVRIRIETQGTGPFQIKKVQDFELNHADWEALMSFAENREWIRVVKHLTTRVSAKAYYHVRQRILAKCGPQGVANEEARWPGTWGSNPTKYAPDLFQEHLTLHMPNIEAGVMPQMMLECGHGVGLPGVEAIKLNGNAVFREHCEECGVRIMKQEDQVYLDGVAQRKEADEYLKMQKVWANLVSSKAESNKPRRFHAVSIFRVLGAALESMQAPEWVAPIAICPTKFEETELALDHLESMFWGQKVFYTRTADKMLEELEDEALGVRMDNVRLGDHVTPPGWDDFLARWLRRTAYFLAYRRCDERDGRPCKGLHLHRDGMWYSPKEWEKDGSESAKEEASMKKVMELLEGIKL